MEDNGNNYGTLGSTPLPPPPPPQFASSSFFTPLIIAMLGIVTTSLLIVAYHVLLVKYCAHRARLQRSAFNQSLQDYNVKREDGVKENVLKTIPILAYSQVKCHVFQQDQSECVVCLGELEDGDMVRLLPHCRHAFHAPCIDQWFSTHSNCPVCRSTIVVVDNPVILEANPLPSSQPPARDFPGQFSGLLQHPRIGLRRSLSMDPYLVLNESLGEIRKPSSESQCCSSSGSCSSQGANLLQSRSMKHLDCMSSRLIRSFSQRFKVGRNYNVNTILPY